MSLKEDVDLDIRASIKAQAQDRLRAFRAIKSMISLAETEKGNRNGLTPELEMNLLIKAVKQRRDSADLYKKQGRDDLYQKEIVELAVIEEYLPKQLSEGELQKELQRIIVEVGATSLKEMGQVMGYASKALAGKADGKSISTVVRKLLS